MIIVDGDCRNLWTLHELEKLLDASSDTLWFCEDSLLREHGYNAAAAANAEMGVSFEKAVLVTRLKNGVMNYHRKMLRNTVGCKRWLIVIVGAESSLYREQYCNQLNSVFGNTIRYEIVFDDPSEMKLALAAKKEIIDDRFFCIIAARSDTQLADDVRSVLESVYKDWRFECHVGAEQDDYKHADAILVIGRSEEDCVVPPVGENSSRVRIWLDMPRGIKAEKATVIDHMNQNGWNLGNCCIRSSCLMNEILLQELENGEISVEGLCNEDDFVMWDQYGLPLPAGAYEFTDQAVEFLRQQCHFPGLLDAEIKGES